MREDIPDIFQDASPHTSTTPTDDRGMQNAGAMPPDSESDQGGMHLSFQPVSYSGDWNAEPEQEQPQDERLRRQCAALRLQSCFRGSLGRKRAEYRRMRVAAATKIQSVVRMLQGRSRARWWRQMNEEATRIQRVFRGSAARVQVDSHRSKAAQVVRIQAVWRGVCARAQAQRMRLWRTVVKDAAVSIQRAWKCHKWRRRQHFHGYRRRAATRIQALWRGYLARLHFERQEAEKQMTQTEILHRPSEIEVESCPDPSEPDASMVGGDLPSSNATGRAEHPTQQPQHAVWIGSLAASSPVADMSNSLHSAGPPGRAAPPAPPSQRASTPGARVFQPSQSFVPPPPRMLSDGCLDNYTPVPAGALGSSLRLEDLGKSPVPKPPAYRGSVASMSQAGTTAAEIPAAPSIPGGDVSSTLVLDAAIEAGEWLLLPPSPVARAPPGVPEYPTAVTPPRAPRCLGLGPSPRGSGLEEGDESSAYKSEHRQVRGTPSPRFSPRSPGASPALKYLRSPHRTAYDMGACLWAGDHERATAIQCAWKQRKARQARGRRAAATEQAMAGRELSERRNDALRLLQAVGRGTIARSDCTRRVDRAVRTLQCFWKRRRWQRMQDALRCAQLAEVQLAHEWTLEENDVTTLRHEKLAVRRIENFWC
eukprot:Hpha_TRINITY_DN16334_c0_g7::TRINITY_DN16334_c0_g7_i1::g.57979::m.57979